MLLEKQLKHFKNLLKKRKAILEKNKFPKTQGKSFNDFQVDLSFYLQSLKELQRIKIALKKIEDETYGICTMCGKKINLKRLEILPETEKCTNCARENGEK
jgi:DnaK suppressor protein